MAEFTDRAGNRIEIPDSEVERGKRVTVRDPRSDSVANVSAKELDEALSQGFELVSEETEREAQIVQQTSAPEQFMEGAAEALTPIISEAARAELEPSRQLLEQKVGPEQAEQILEQEAQRRQVEQEQFGFARGAGEITGFLGSAAIPGTAPGMALRGGGRLAARVLGREGAEALGERALKRAGTEAIEEGAEGAVFSAKQQLTEDALGDTELNGERLAASIGIGSLIGAGGGALFGGTATLLGPAAKGITRGAGKAVQRTKSGLKNLYGSSRGATLTDTAADAYVKYINKTKGEEAAQTVQRALDDPEVNNLVRKGDSVIEDEIPTFRERIDELDRTTMQTQEFAKGSLKRSNIIKGVRELDDQIEGESRALVAELRGLVDEINETPSAFEGAAQARNRLQRLADDTDAALDRSIQKGGKEATADAFMAMDNAKRSVGQMRVKAARSGFVKDRFEQLYERYRKSLESEDLWGKGAAQAQQEINGVWAPMIGNAEQFSKKFMSKSGQREGFEPIYTADPTKLDTYLKNLGTGKNQLADEVFDRQIRLQKEFQDVVRKHYDLPEDVSKKLDDATVAADKIRTRLNELTDVIRTRNQLEDLDSGFNASGVGATIGATVGGAAGSVTGTPGLGAGLGATVGSALAGAATSPKRAVQSLSTLGDMTKRMRRQTNDRAEAYVAKVTQDKPDKSPPPLPRRDKLVPSALTPAALESFREEVDHILDATTNPQATAEAASERLGDVAQAAPNTSAKAVQTATRAAQYLRQQIPPAATQRRNALTPHLREDIRAPDTDVASFLRTLRAVQDPSTVLEDLENGTLTLEGVDALRNVYPRMYDSLVMSVFEQLAEAEKPVPYEHRVRLGILLGQPTDPSLEPDFIATMQEAVTRPPQDEQPPSIEAPKDMGESQLTEQQRLRQRPGA